MSDSKNKKFNPEDTQIGLELSITDLDLEGIPIESRKALKSLIKARDNALQLQHKENIDQHQLLHGYLGKDKKHVPGIMERLEALEEKENKREELRKKAMYMWAGIALVSPVFLTAVVALGKALLAKMGIKL